MFIKKKEKIKICIFSGSELGKNDQYRYESKLLTKYIIDENWNIIYGAGKIGLMGEVANTALKLNGNIKGVVPDFLHKKEIVKSHLTKLKQTSNLFDRKKYMIENSDAFIILPGGIGTLDELFDVLAHTKLELLKKPIILLNIHDYWKPLEILIKHICIENFAREEDFVTLKFSKNSNHAIKLLKEFFQT